MRAMFMIPSRPSPTFREPEQWSPEFVDFVSRCLVKDPADRATAAELLQHEFILTCKPVDILTNMIEEAKLIREQFVARKGSKDVSDSEDEEDSGTMIRQNHTLRPESAS